ncbi:hypothetical protein BH10PSE3_BH10PSE3_38890 [soil metagenome]
MINLRTSAAVLALTAAGYAGSALAQQTAPATDPSAQTTQQAPLPSTTSPGVDPSTATPPPAEADSAAASGTPSSATAVDPAVSDTAAPAADAKPEKKSKKHHKPAGAEAPDTAATSSDAPK